MGSTSISFVKSLCSNRSSEVKCKQWPRVLLAHDAGHVPDLDDPLGGAGHEDGRAEGVPLDAVHGSLVRTEPGRYERFKLL